MKQQQASESERSSSRQLVLQFLVFLCVIQNSVAENEELSYRLPNNTYPLRYNLELTTHIHDNSINNDRFNFEGKVTIQLTTIGGVETLTENITLHYRQINITRVKLWNTLQDGWENILLDDVSSFTLNPLQEFLTVHSPKPLNGTYFLEIRYNGILREDNGGFYRSSYVDNNGITQWLATTQFSPTDARHLFPCYDEPGIRAPIALRVVHGNNYSVLSNMIPIDVRESILEGMLITTFPDTPSMPPYLLGVVVSDFKQVSIPLFAGQSAFIRPTALSSSVADFIIEAGFKILQYLEKFLETPYILPKLYHVAIPDFSPGAMENYGLITYKEENFMFDAETSPIKQKMKISSTVAHEIGHHYFGNYVSPAWWSYLWMKEGFARFFEYAAAQAAFPELGLGIMYAVDKTHNVFQIDSLSSSRPMTYDVNSQIEISNIFDDIAYDKGGAILLMFHHAFGQESFRQAMINFLQTNALQTATPEKFASAMQKTMFDTLPSGVLNFNASSLLKSWTEQPGYPILYISRFGDRCSLRIEQERYLLKSTDTSNSNVTWIIPYNFATKTQQNFHNTTYAGWITAKHHVINQTADMSWTCDDWIVFNKQQTSYYRINYDDQLWLLIIEALFQNNTLIHEANRAQLIDDALNCARSGRLMYAIPLQLLRYLSKEVDYIPWAAVDRNLGLLDILMKGTDKYDVWLKYCLEFIEPTYSRMGMITHEQDTVMQRMTREIVINWACRVGSQACLNSTAFIITEIAENRLEDTDPDIREAVYCNGLRNASGSVFDSIWQKMQASQNQLQRSELIRSLGCVENGQIILKYLQSTIALDNSSYFNQERERVLISVCRNSVLGLEIAMNFLQKNADLVNTLYNKGNFGGRAISSIVRRIAQQITNKEMHIKLQDLMEELLAKGFLRSSDILQALEYSSENLMWIQERGMQIASWLDDQYPSPNTFSSTPVVTNSEPEVTVTDIPFSISSTIINTYTVNSSSQATTVANTFSSHASTFFEQTNASTTVAANSITPTMNAETYDSNFASRGKICNYLIVGSISVFFFFNIFENIIL